MRCYYEVLGVPKNVESVELKKAYYKMSLQWHPDKNSASKDTTKIFQEIQEAYRVLSDPHERAWYDSHRTQILYSGSHHAHAGAQSQFQEERLDVFEYFSRSSFEAFDDGPKGFYTVYRKVFEMLAEEERRAAADDAQSDSDEDDTGGEFRAEVGKRGHHYPTFGSSTSDYSPTVASFYQFWEMFQTRKNYTWVEKYDIRCAQSRQERRAMEAENRRLRNAAKKKRNEEVRELVSFVKKRDKRVAAERERVQLAKKEVEARRHEISRQARLRNAEKLADAWLEEQEFGGLSAQWTKDFEAELARMEAELDNVNPAKSGSGDDVSGSDNDDSLDAEQLYCVACDKVFSSVNAKQNHDASKKHRRQVDILRQLLLEEQNAANVQDNLHSDEAEEPVASAVAEVKLTKRAKKAQRRRLREAEKQNTADDEVSTVRSPSETENDENVVDHEDRSEARQPNPVKSEPSSSLLCETCQTEFPSRNKLFAHLKESNHATVKVATGPKGKTRKKR